MVLAGHAIAIAINLPLATFLSASPALSLFQIVSLTQRLLFPWSVPKSGSPE